MLWIKEVEVAKSIDEHFTSRSIAGQHNFSWFRYAWCNDCVSLEEALQHAVDFPKKSTCRRATSSKISDRILRGRHIAHMIDEYVRATGAFETVQGLADLVSVALQNAEVQDFDVRWDHARLSIEWHAVRPDPGRIVQVKITEFRSTSDCDGFVWSGSCSRQWWDTELSTIENCSETPHFDKSEPQSPERCCGKGFSHQESKRRKTTPAVKRKVGECFQWKAPRTMFQRRLL